MPKPNVGVDGGGSDTQLFAGSSARPDMVDTVVQNVSRLIAGNKLKPGQRLPPEAVLGEKIGVSRTVVREAMRVLATLGLVETRHGVGTIVKASRVSCLAGPISSMFRLREISIEDLHAVRTMLEVEIAGKAAENATRTDIAKLAKLVDVLESSTDRPLEYVRADDAFHRYLAEMSRNRLLATLLDSIADILTDVRLSVTRYPEIFKAGVADHRRIMKRVRDHDVNGARQAMRKHLDVAQDILERTVISDAASAPAGLL
jgi:GntR family transcriptional repressor for pyruvate dehydrogenase complex